MINVKESMKLARQEAEQALKLSYALDHLRALLAVDTWAGLVGSGGQRCRTCWEYYPDHKPDCPRQAAQAYLDGLE